MEVKNAKCLIEISRNCIAGDVNSVDIGALPEVSCILIASPEFESGEADYYRNVLGFQGDFLPAGSLEEARFMVAGGRGFLPLEAIGKLPESPETILRVPLYRGTRRMTRKYCLFWRKERSNVYIEEFAELFQKWLS